MPQRDLVADLFGFCEDFSMSINQHQPNLSWHCYATKSGIYQSEEEPLGLGSTCYSYSDGCGHCYVRYGAEHVGERLGFHVIVEICR